MWDYNFHDETKQTTKILSVISVLSYSGFQKGTCGNVLIIIINASIRIRINKLTKS